MGLNLYVMRSSEIRCGMTCIGKPTFSVVGVTPVSWANRWVPSSSSATATMYGAYFAMLSGGNVTIANVKIFPFVGASYHSNSDEPHWQCCRGGMCLVPHFWHFVPISLPCFKASRNFCMNSVSGSHDT